MATYQVSLLPGDGIGPEVTEATRRVLEATGIGFEWDYCDAGLDALEKVGDVLPEATLDSVRKNGLGLKGPITTPIGTGFRSVNVGLRQALNLYANLRPGKTIKGVQAAFSDVDLVIVRENLEDTYAGVEFDTGTPEAHEVIAEINKRSKKQ
ncbi:MAG TPA: isocitrate/isopropylmalate family dehydrogenase, partial [Thermomicrobiales bacterium]|nr:isocitrate/isopropylmalate family dehydrogenase [Thermomicrobiales bacterium]